MTETVRVLTFLVALLMTAAGCDGESKRQYYESAGGFSFDPPAGWKVVEFPGFKYRICHGPDQNGFAPNVNVIDEAFEGTLASYADLTLQNMQRVLTKARLLSREDFSTQDSEPAVKIVIENEQSGQMLRQAFFLIGSGDQKFVMTCTARADRGGQLDSAFDECARSFRIH